MIEPPVQSLLASSEPSIRYKALVTILGTSVSEPQVRQVQEEVRQSRRAETLLLGRGADGLISCHPYAKWYGAHWVLATLADLGYPPGDESLIPLRDQTLEWLTSKDYERWIRKPKRGPVRIHASIDGNALFATLMLGLPDPRLDILVERLLSYQWPDGGWNCDIDSKGETSSFDETLIPFRALALHARLTANAETRKAALRAAEVFLCRGLYKRRSDGRVIKRHYVKLHYPCYWHYDILFGLKVMAEAQLIADRRCGDALDLLESKRLPDGGFPAEERYYQASAKIIPSRHSLVDWGGTSRLHMNQWVTADALAVLHAAGRRPTG